MAVPSGPWAFTVVLAIMTPITRYACCLELNMGGSEFWWAIQPSSVKKHIPAEEATLNRELNDFINYSIKFDISVIS